MQSLFGEQKSLLSLRGEFGKPPAAVPSSGPGSQMDVGSKGLHMPPPPSRPNALPEGGAQNPVHVSVWAHRIPSNFFSCVVQWPVQFFSVGVRNCHFFQFGSTESRPFFQLCGAVFRPFFQCEGTESRPIFQFGAFRIPSIFFVQLFPLTT